MVFNSSNLSQSQLYNFNRAQYNKIYAHEAAHKAQGGSLTGPIVIEKNQDGTPIAGHVEIKMPALDSSNPDKTIEDAKIVINSALAPSDPSEQDLKVAAQAKNILNQAQNIKNNNEQGSKLNIIA